MKKYFAVSLLCLAAACPFTFAQSVPLSFRPVDSAYSKPLDRIIMISANPDQLHIYDPPTNSDIVVNLSKAPLNLSVSPDGTHAAVMHDSLVSYVNLSTARVEKTFAVAASTGVVTLSEDYIYVLPTYEGSIYSILISTGLVSGGTAPFYYTSGGKFNSYTKAVYSTWDGISPNNLLKYDASGGVLKNSTTSPYWGDFPVCGPVWFSPDERTIYTACGGVYRASTDATVDRKYKASFPGINEIQYLDSSSTLDRVAVIPSTDGRMYPLPEQADNEVRLFDADYLGLVGRFAIQDFTVGGNSFKAHGKAVFFSQSSSALYVVAEADNTSGLLNDFAIQTISLSNPRACDAYFGDSSASAAASGELKTVQITAGDDCVFSVQSQASWLIPVSGQYGSGDTTLTYMVRPNLGAQSRSGTISIGNTKLTVTQSGAAAISDFNRLSFKVSAADYSKTLNKLVLASANPNELHIYDPISEADRIVPLVREPVSVSVGPDGMHAAVGHDGSVSYVNLQTAAVENVLPIPERSYGLSLAGNGYAYAFAGTSTTNMVSLNLTTGIVTPRTAIYAGTVARLTPSGEFLYAGSFNGMSKWNLASGPAQPIGNSIAGPATCGNFWLAEDGNRLFTACATVYRTSEVPSDDLTPNGKLPNANALTWATNSLTRGITAVIPATNYSLTSVDDTLLQAYSDENLSLISQLALPQFTIEQNQYAGHGRFVFWNSSGSTLFVVVQADTQANLSSDYAVYTIKSLPSLTSCSVSVSPDSIQSPASGTWKNIDITTGPLCPWSAHSNASWLFVSGVTGGNGSAKVSVSVGYNSGPARTGTITINDRTITITQDGIGVDPGPTPPPTSLDFGSQTIGVQSQKRSISLSDLYTPFQISAIAITPNSGEFAIQPGGCQANQRYSVCTLSLLFTPKEFGKRTASLTFNINGSAKTVALSGFGVSVAGFQGGTFEIRNRLSGKVLDVTNFSTEPGTRIQQWQAAGTDNQKWLVIPQAGGYYKIQNQLTGQVLDVRNFSSDNGAAIQQWDDAGSQNQRWSIIPADGQYYEIVNKLSGKALDVANFSVDNGAPLQQWQYGATKNQQWEFVPIANGGGTTQSSTLPTGYITIVNRNSGKVLDVTNFSKNDGTPIQQWIYAATENQEWQFAPVSNGYYKIVNKLSGKVLDVRNFSTDNGAVVQQWTYEQSDNQLWKIAPVDGQYFKIVNKSSGRVLDITDFSTENGGQLQQWDDAGSENQEWSFLPVEN